ncbi:hypothetical protein LL250_17185, partial [Halomonas meridiana]|nr:hypothetical protein [Halomonas meridiana]
REALLQECRWWYLGMIIHGGFIQAATRRLRGCLLRSLLSLSRYAALRGKHSALMVRSTLGRPP